MSRVPLSSLIIGSLSQSGDSCDSTSTTLKGNSFRDIKKALPDSPVARRSLCLQFHTPRDVGCRNVLPLCRVPLLRRFTSEKRSLDSILISSRTNLFKMRTKPRAWDFPWLFYIIALFLSYSRSARNFSKITLEEVPCWRWYSSKWLFVRIRALSLAFICPSYNNWCDFEPFTKNYSLNCKRAENAKWR